MLTLRYKDKSEYWFLNKIKWFKISDFKDTPTICFLTKLWSVQKNFKYKNFGSPGTKVLCHRIYRGRMPRRFPWRWHFHFWIHKLRCCLIFFHSYKQETLNSPKIMTIDEKFSISINCIQTMGGRFQFSYLRPAFVFEHFFVQVRY